MKINKDLKISDLALYLYKFAEVSKDVFWIMNEDYRKNLYISPAFEKVWGFPREIIYKTPTVWLTTLLPDDAKKMKQEIRQRRIAPSPEDIYQADYQIYRADKSICWIHDISFPLFENGKLLGFAGIAQDVTNEVLQQKELHEAKFKAESANRAKADFLAMMSHELRTPLNAILGMAQILQMKGLPKELEDCVSVILHAGKGLLSLVTDILDFATLEVGKLSFSKEPFDLNILIAQVVHSFYHQALEKRIEIIFNYESESPTLVIGDAKRIRQVLINLIGNAFKFTDEGYIKITTKCLRINSAEVIYEIIVSDTGIGISHEKLDFIFEKFSQIDSTYQRKHSGAGLGLAISKELVEKMGGSIVASSELTKGTEFSFTLPLKLQTSTLEKTLDDSFAVDKENIKTNISIASKVLLVEDNSVNQKIAKIMLEELGCEVHIVETGTEALNYLADHQHGYEIVFMDIGLPDMTGFEVTKKIRAINYLKDIPIIAMTAHILEHDRKECRKVKMDMMIAKPISHEELRKTLAYCAIKKKKTISI